jgi:hypothetical protein
MGMEKLLVQHGKNTIDGRRRCESLPAEEDGF